MVKHSYGGSEFDQHDSKVFRETLGTFGTTTNPASGQNQLQQLQAKVREGVKHVELALGGAGKGNFGALDTPDKYGFEQRRTIMQLAKLNQQTLSVHATFNVVSFSGIGQGGFDESQRLMAIKEIDETLKFAAETTKGGAVVMHLQGDPISTDKSELNLSKRYLDWLEQNKPDEFKRIKAEYYDENPLNRKFINNPINIMEVREEFEKLKGTSRYDEFVKKAKDEGGKRGAWEYFYIDKNVQKQKLAPDRSPLVMVGDKIEQTARQQEFLDLSFFKDGKGLSDSEKSLLKGLDINVDNFNLNEVQKAQALFSNGFPGEYEGKISKDDFTKLKSKILIDYNKVFGQSMNSQAQADKKFHEKLIDFQVEMIELQKKDLDINYAVNEDFLHRIRELEKRERDLANEMVLARKSGDSVKVAKIRQELHGGKELSGDDQKKYEELVKIYQNPSTSEVERRKAESELIKIQKSVAGLEREKLEIMQTIGQLEYQKLEKYHELKADLNQKEHLFKQQRDNVKAVTDEIFDKNVSALAHLGMKALKYQLDLKLKSKDAKGKAGEFDSQIIKLEKAYDSTTDFNERNDINLKILKLKSQQRHVVGLSDYSDIDLINKPLYIAPENMLPGMGSITSIEEFKAAIRMSQQDFAKRILSDESEYKKLREIYEKETGIKITSANAMELAKRHVAGTFDNAHAAGWLKHFKAEDGESEEHKIDRFNKWLNSQAEEMVKEGIVKHVHFNDSMGKDDDHNMLGTGVLDLHDLRDRLRKAGMREALIVEAGGRGNHMKNAFDFFNPAMRGGSGVDYGIGASTGRTVSDWVSVKRDYQNRPQYSSYGMGYSTFRHIPPGQGQEKGEWSQTGFF